jgi:hypothetical protein
MGCCPLLAADAATTNTYNPSLLSPQKRQNTSISEYLNKFKSNRPSQEWPEMVLSKKHRI